MPTCKLSAAGRETIERAADIIRDGGTLSYAPPFIKKSGFEIIGEGDARLVFAQDPDADATVLPDDCVVKLSKWTDPWQMHNEILNWEHAPPEAREVLAPIHQIADDGLWLTMPRAEGLDVQSDPWSVLEPLEEAGYTLADVRADHIGLVNGVPKIIDYGHRIHTLDGERVGPPSSEVDWLREYGFFARKERAGEI